MGYTAKHHVDHNQIGYAPGDPVRFTADEIAEYQDTLSGPIAALLAADAIEGERPLLNAGAGEPSIEQLVAIAKALGLPVAEPLDRVVIEATIAEARARLAAPPPPNTPPLPPVSATVMTAEGPKSTPSEPGGNYAALSVDLGLERLAEIATLEGASYAEGADLAAIVAAIEARRAAPAELKPNLTRGQLADIAIAEQVEFAPNATRAEILAAIQAKRDTPPAPAA